MKEICIFDIDGCILQSMFPNLDDNIKSREKLIVEALKKIDDISLFPEFVIYYKRFCEHSESIFFITGRRESEFGELTKMQLSPLKNIKEFRIIYYPEENSYESKEYFNWKIEKIQKIFNDKLFQGFGDKSSKKNLYFKIFDDMPDYFPKVEDLAKNLDIQVKLVRIIKSESWSSLLK